jgi:hypothetical protein
MNAPATEAPTPVPTPAAGSSSNYAANSALALIGSSLMFLFLSGEFFDPGRSLGEAIYDDDRPRSSSYQGLVGLARFVVVHHNDHNDE